MQVSDALFSLHDRLLIAVFGLLLHMLVMRPAMLIKLYPFAPFAWCPGVMRWLEHRLNRISRGQSALKFRGMTSSFIVLFISLITGLFFGVLAKQLTHGELLELALVCIGLNARPALETCWQVFTHVKNKKPILPSTLIQLAHPAVDTKDEYSVMRAAIEQLYTRYCIQVVSPLLWYALCGMPGLVICVTITQAEKILRARGLHGALFGYSLRIIFLLVHLVPACIAGVFVSIASVFIPSCHPVRAVFMMFCESEKLRGTPFGWTLGALSGALSLALAGPRSHYALLKETPWVGNGSARPSSRDMVRAMFLYGIALQLVLLAMALALYLLKRAA